MDTPHGNVPEEQWIRWKKKRRNTVIGYMIVGAMVGIDYSFMFTTLYLYLTDMIKTDRPTLFYGIIIAGYSLSSTVFGMICGRWVDRTRKIKLYTICTLTFQIVGCLLYVVNFSVWYPLIGRLICGLGDPFPSVTSGEIIRIYDKEGSTRALWWLASIYSIGSMVGPIVTLFFKDIDLYIWTIHVTQLNVIAIFMAGLLLLTLLSALFLLHDCSAEIDVKNMLQENITDKKRERVQNKDANTGAADEITALLSSPNKGSDSVQHTIPINILVKTLLNKPDAVLMFVSTFLFMYCLFSSDVLLPLLAQVLLKWSLTALTLILVGNGVIYFILLMIMAKFCTTDRGVYIMSVICIVAQIIMFGTSIAMKLFERDLTRDIVLIVMFVVSWVFSWIIEEVIIRCMLAKMVPSNAQSFVETMRNGVSRLSTIFASISAPLVLPFLHWWSASLIVVIFILLLAFIVRKKSLLNIKEIDFDSFYTPIV